MNEVTLKYDDLADVVSIYFTNSRAICAKPANDQHLILEIDGDDQVVGIEILNASILHPEFCNRHPERHLIPELLLAELDRWIKTL